MRKLTIWLILLQITISMMASQSSIDRSRANSELVGEVGEITPLGTAFTYETDDFELKVVVPSYINLSTSDEKRPARLNIYLKILEALSGLFRVDVEFGIGVSFPPAIYGFSDTDITWLGTFYPDVIRLFYPIWGIPPVAMSLESGDVGVYALAVPVKVAEVELESLPVGEWSHVGSYDLYVLQEPKLMIMDISTEDVTIGEVTCLETEYGEFRPEYNASSIKGFGFYGCDHSLISIQLLSMGKSLYPGDALTLRTGIKAETGIHLLHLTLKVYGAREVGGEYVSVLIVNVPILKDIWLASGVLITEDLKFTIPEDTLPGMLYSIVSAQFTEGQKHDGLATEIWPPVDLSDDFTLVYVKNRAYERLKVDYDDLASEYESRTEAYDQLNATYHQLNTAYDDLTSEYESAIKESEMWIREAGITTNSTYVLIITTIAFAATTVYLLRKRQYDRS